MQEISILSILVTFLIGLFALISKKHDETVKTGGMDVSNHVKFSKEKMVREFSKATGEWRGGELVASI